MEPSRVVGPYALYETLGTGASAAVHLGVSRAGEVPFPVAIKRLHDPRATASVARLIDEVRVIQQIHHPNVVGVHELVIDGDDVLAVLEYVHAEPLSRLLAEAPGPVPADIACAIAAGALRGLDAAHAALDESGRPLGLVHRDVTPENILVGEDGHARLTDFGVAKAEGRLHATIDGGVKGKLAYMAPEQIGGEVTAATDIYAMGLVLWEMLTGTRAIPGETEAQLVARALDPALAPPGVDPELDAIVMHALALDPGARYATAGDLAAALEPFAAPDGDVRAWVRAVAGDRLDRRLALVESLVGAPAPARSPARPAPSRVGLALLAISAAVTAFLVIALQPSSRTEAKPVVDVPSVTASVSVAPVVTPAITATATAIATVTASAPATATASVPAVPRPIPRPRPRHCDVPVIDSAGIRRYDPACFQ